MTDLYCCEFCGKDTKNKCRICRGCLGGRDQDREHAESNMMPFDLFLDEAEHDYSENALGPKQAEDRIGAKWHYESGDASEWRKCQE